MTYVQGIVLGLVQGITEFLPISSSGHLILVPHLLGWPDQGQAVDAALHLGTLVALLMYFRAELIGFVRGTMPWRLGLVIIVATIPGALAGLLFGAAIEEHLRSPLLIAVSTAFWGVVMWLADRSARAHERGVEHIGWGPGVAVGVAQTLALVPGTSRSGITITTGLFSGLDRPTAARYAFLLGIPITAGAGALKTLHIVRHGLDAQGGLGPLAAAIAVSGLTGWVVVSLLVNYLRRNSLLPFVIYRLVLAAVIVALIR